MEVVMNGANCVFIELNGNVYCYSYGQKVAAIIDGEYIEYQGDKYYSRTSCKHKSQFRKYYNY